MTIKPLSQQEFSNPISDAKAREEALNPHLSFIIQAPAGSGKTGLLTQRFLCLLSLVNHPEELVAITFTRKAAAEMKSRILEALEQPINHPCPPPEKDFLHRTWTLASKALKQDADKKWRILKNPGRLRIYTIDALSANLTRQLPILSRMGGGLGITDQAHLIYRQAARSTLEEGNNNNRWSPLIGTLLDHLDNNLSVAESLMATMLARRDQWLRHIHGQNTEESRALLESVLQHVVVEGLTKVDQEIAPLLKEELWSLALFAGTNLKSSVFLKEDSFPKPHPDYQEQWLALTELLLTKSGDWRKRLDVRSGFPAQSQGKSKEEKAHLKTMKLRMEDLIQRFSQHSDLLDAFETIRTLPSSHYSSSQWMILQALLKLLPMMVAQLLLQFQATGEVDFSEISQRAETALGEPDAPSNLALKLDYQIKHLLVDEFQDTSHGQYRLLERLTAGWDGSDGRSLFLVGDPMQSIYRFREAEVGLFLKARQEGIGMIPLIPLSLTVNFRSQANLVAWINQAFSDILPNREDRNLGAVSFNACHPFQPALEEPSVVVHPFWEKDRPKEALKIVELVHQALEKNHSIAILVRSRTHLQHILPALSHAGLDYQGIDIEPLGKSMIIQDLLSLTRALTCPADRLAWFSILRAPWCGLSLHDLHTLTQHGDSQTLWQQILNAENVHKLSEDGQHRLTQLQTVLNKALQQRRRCNSFSGTSTLSFWVENTWQLLGGPATLPNKQALSYARTYFNLLSEVESGGELPNFSEFADQVDSLYGGVDPEAKEGLSIMTIHKAKGLEFDTVILPGLGQKPRGEEKTLMAWMEHQAGLLIAPIKRSDQDQDDSIHAFLRRVEKKKAGFEAGRLLYVAATRARKQLHLLGHVKKEDSPPESGSFLHLLWNTVQADFSDPPQTEYTESFEGNTSTPRPLKRLVSGWSPPPLPEIHLSVQPPSTPSEEPIPFEWAGETVRLVGIVVHRFMHILSLEDVSHWNEHSIQSRKPSFVAHLIRLGLPKDRLDSAVKLIETALQKTVMDRRGQWIFDNSHHQVASEFAVTGLIQDKTTRIVLDRTFVDQEGIRWIIDFKTSWHQGGDLQGFLNNEQIRYQNQMLRYGYLMQKLDPNHPIRLGLYFPMHSEWREWPLENVESV